MLFDVAIRTLVLELSLMHSSFTGSLAKAGVRRNNSGRMILTVILWRMKAPLIKNGVRKAVGSQKTFVY